MSGGTGPTVLIADDDADLLLLMSRRLSRAGYPVITATDGQQALDMVARCSPELVVLDVTMPNLSGPEVLERLRADPATSTLLVVLVSAGFGSTVAGVGLPAGADDYLGKPFPPGELCTRVAALFAARPDRAGGAGT